MCLCAHKSITNRQSPSRRTELYHFHQRQTKSGHKKRARSLKNTLFQNAYKYQGGPYGDSNASRPVAPYRGYSTTQLQIPTPKTAQDIARKVLQQRKTLKRIRLVLRLVQFIKALSVNSPQRGLFKGVENVEKDQTQGKQTRKVARGSILHFPLFQTNRPPERKNTPYSPISQWTIPALAVYRSSPLSQFKL